MSVFSRPVQKNPASEEQESPKKNAALTTHSAEARSASRRRLLGAVSLAGNTPVLRALLVVLCATYLALAQGRVGVLIDQLKNGTDFRLRTQAALALGTSDDPSAAAPLCEALDDASDSVRSAAAAALGKLKNPAGLPCLRNHMGEMNASVRFVIERSMNALQGLA